MMFLKVIKKIANLEKRNEARKNGINDKELQKIKDKEEQDAKETSSSHPVRNAEGMKKVDLTLDIRSLISGKIDEKKKKVLWRLTVVGVISVLLISVKEFRIAAFLLALIFLASVSKLIQEPIPFVVGLDLCLFVTTVVGYVIHPLVGFVVGGTSSIIGSFLRQTEGVENVVVPVLGYLWSSIAVWVLHTHASLWQVGVVTTLLYTFHNVIIFGYLRHFSIHSITFMATSIPFNLFLISRFGEKLIALLA